MKKQKDQSAFTLLELLVVIAVILIISAIAIPNLIRSKIAANEASAVGSLRTLNSSCIIYSSIWGVGYPLALSRLGPGTPASVTAANLIDRVLAAGTKSGYGFTYVSGAPVGGKILTYTINANPLTPGTTGSRYFFTDESNVIRYSTSGSAVVTSPPIN